MFETMYLKAQVIFAQKTNRFIYTIRRFPWIGNNISEEWYVRSDIKKILGVLSMIRAFIWDIVCKAFYLMCLVVLPALFAQNIMQTGPMEYASIWIFFWLNCMLGSFRNSQIFGQCDEGEYLLLNLMRMNPKQHFVSKMWLNHGKQIVYYGILFAIIIMRVGKRNVLYWVFFVLIYASFRGIGEARRLRWNLKYGIIFQAKSEIAKGNYYLHNMICFVMAYLHNMICFVMAYLPFGGLFLCKMLQIDTRDFNLLCAEWALPVMGGVAVLSVVLGILSIRLLSKYTGYTNVARKVCNRAQQQERMETVKSVQNVKAQVDKTVILEEKDHSRLFDNKEGYEYMNALFFRRHKKLVRDATRIKVLIAAAVMVIMMVVSVVFMVIKPGAGFQKYCNEFWKLLLSLLPCFVFIMYCASSGQNLTQAMFYNCDVSLLKYGYYRTQGAVLLNFRIRLRYMLRAELPMILTLCGGLLVNFILIRQYHHVWQILSILICVAMLSVFYSVLFLCMYYIFQPFTEGGEKTGVGYKFCSAAIYILSYSCLQIHTSSEYFSVIVSAVTIVVLILSFILAYCFAPKTFHLK